MGVKGVKETMKISDLESLADSIVNLLRHTTLKDNSIGVGGKDGRLKDPGL